MRRWVVIWGVVLALGAAGSAVAAPEPPLSHEGRWITDSEGRVVILHGLNQVAKLESDDYLPKRLPFGRDDAEAIAREGFNSVRTGSSTRASSPTPAPTTATTSTASATRCRR